MADIHHHEEGGIGLVRLQRIINVTGAAVSVALVVGVVLWGYRLAVRDVAEIPVVRALETPMRIAPANPGGEIATNLGLSVNAIAAEGTVPPPPEQLLLAPRPVDLAPEDQPYALAPETAVVEGALPAPQVLEDGADGITPLIPVETPTQSAPAAPADLASDLPPDLGADVIEPEPLAAVQADDSWVASVDEAMASSTAVGADGTTGADGTAGADDTAGRGLRPMPRPTPALRLASVAPVSTPAPVETVAVASASVSVGTRLVQLGAFDNAADAAAEWNRLIAQFGDLVAGKSRVIQDAQSGGRNFVRLRAMGFADEADARRFCSALLSENAVCVPVSQR